MKKLLIAAFLLAAPAAVLAQSTPEANVAPSSKINIAVRADMAQAEAQAESRSVGTVKARSARIAGKTVRLVDGSLPADVQSAAVSSPNTGS
jgi:hypothetical protein